MLYYVIIIYYIIFIILCYIILLYYIMSYYIIWHYITLYYIILIHYIYIYIYILWGIYEHFVGSLFVQPRLAIFKRHAFKRRARPPRAILAAANSRPTSEKESAGASDRHRPLSRLCCFLSGRFWKWRGAGRAACPLRSPAREQKHACLPSSDTAEMRMSSTTPVCRTSSNTPV